VSQSELDKAAYVLAKDFLLRFSPEGVTPELIEKYLHLSKAKRPKTLPDLYGHLLESAQNSNRKPGVVGGAIGGVGKLRPVLCNFEPAQILEKYPSGWETVLDDIVNQLKPRSSIRRNPRSIWPLYCRSILSGAKFLSQFSSVNDFYEWVEYFDKDERARPALPMLLEKEIAGFGFALACDFLKELGYENFSKPDVHVKDIFQAMGLCLPASSDYEVFKAVARVARNVGVTPYNVDKLFWLVGSGNFYDDPQIGNRGRIGRHRQEFIEEARPMLAQMQ
jgi:hypothetical protein